MSAKSILFVARPDAVTDLFPKFREAGIEAGLVEDVKSASAYIRKHKPLLVVAKPSLPGFNRTDFISLLSESVGGLPFVVLSDKASAEDAAEFLEAGAKDYWIEPLQWEKIAASLPGEEPAAPAAPKPAPKATKEFSIIGDHPSIKRVLALAKQVAPSKATVLISGESGTGKEMFARYLHFHSDRRDKPFVAINCAALPEHLLESELFGHEKGAFTGAVNRKLGKFELADGGVILLDEITEMDLGLQAKLLRVLQEGELDRVGGVETVSIDVRVLATTNRNIEESVKEKQFRQDLYFRLNVIPLKLPPLAERGDDVLLLADYFAGKFAKSYGMKKPSYSNEAKAWLTSYEWPGNVRELQNLMERAVLLAMGGEIGKQHFLMDADAWPILEESSSEGSEGGPAGHSGDDTGQGDVERTVGAALAGGELRLEDIERIAIMQRLEETSGNRTQAAEVLGISVRTLRNKLNEYRKLGMSIP